AVWHPKTAVSVLTLTEFTCRTAMPLPARYLRSFRALLAWPALRAGRRVEADRGRGGQVQALRPAVDGHAHRLVGQREQPARQPPVLVPDQPRGGGGDPAVRLELVELPPRTAVGGQNPDPGPGQRRGCVRERCADHDREMEQAARRGAHALAVVGVDR